MAPSSGCLSYSGFLQMVNHRHREISLICLFPLIHLRGKTFPALPKGRRRSALMTDGNFQWGKPALKTRTVRWRKVPRRGGGLAPENSRRKANAHSHITQRYYIRRRAISSSKPKEKKSAAPEWTRARVKLRLMRTSTIMMLSANEQINK